MLREFGKVRQDRGAYRRLFTDEYFDLYLWYRWRLGRLRGFQLVYDKEKKPRSLRWTRREGFHHDAVDDGDYAGGNKGTPYLVPDGTMDCAALAERFLQASGHLPRRLGALVHGAILEYGRTGGEG